MGLTINEHSTAEQAIEGIATMLSRDLASGRRVVWLMSGGSAIIPQLRALERLTAQEKQKLTVTLLDERYGAPGHDDSNWTQLLAAGLSLESQGCYVVLQGDRIESTADRLAEFLDKSLASGDVCVASFGIGSDAHVAGLLPDSLILGSPKSADWYQTDQYQRISVTPAFFKRLSEACVFASGPGKATAIQRLKAKFDQPEDVPALYLHDVPKVTVYYQQELSVEGV